MLGGPARAVAVLVVATPCPLMLAAPVALVSGLSVKNGGVLERLAQCTTLLLDKTGTLTAGQPAVTAIVSAGSRPAGEILRLAACLDQVSGHVLAGAVVRAAAERKCQLVLPKNVAEEPGQGIAGTVDGHHVTLGRAERAGITSSPPWVSAAHRRARLDGVLTVFVAIDRRPGGALLLQDRIRPDARATIRALRQGGIRRIVLATGDRAEVADALGAITGVDEVLAGLTPVGKLEVVRREQRHGPVIMTGDGINDAPALAQADVGVAMGARGSTASSEAADALAAAAPDEAMAQVRNAYHLLSTEIAPHESAEETQLYPMVNRLLGGNDPTAPMSRGHAEIAHQIARLGRLLNDIGDRDPDEADLADLRGMLYGLEAILRLHTAQEDETYLSLGDTADELSLSAGAS